MDPGEDAGDAGDIVTAQEAGGKATGDGGLADGPGTDEEIGLGGRRRLSVE